MMQGPQARLLPDGSRLHLNHGPIDLIVEAFGPAAIRAAAYERATRRFANILEELVADLRELRRPAGPVPRPFSGPVAQRMERAVVPLSAAFVTPMAAVAGSVADEMLAALLGGDGIAKAYVNNGGDVALHLAPGEKLDAAIAGTGHGLADRVCIHAADGIGGMATSGWRGRSHSLGIADAVTVLARTAAEADAAATLIANAIDLPGHAAIERVPANTLSPDSDLGGRLVTCGVSAISPTEAAAALHSGLAVADQFRRKGLIAAAALFLQGQHRHCGAIDLAATAPEAEHAIRKERRHA
jgi:ApbE superfamily uncharacterized protein (UPF0280 family)